MLSMTVILDAPSGVTVAVPLILEPLIGLSAAVHFMGATAAVKAPAAAARARRIIANDLQWLSAIGISDAAIPGTSRNSRTARDCYVSTAGMDLRCGTYDAWIASSSCAGSVGRGVSIRSCC